MDYWLRYEWLRSRDDKWRVSFPRPTFILFENRNLGALTRVRVRELRIQSPNIGGVCGVSQWPSNASGRLQWPVSGSTVPGACHRLRKLSRSRAAARPRDDNRKRKGGADRTRFHRQPRPTATRARRQYLHVLPSNRRCARVEAEQRLRRFSPGRAARRHVIDLPGSAEARISSCVGPPRALLLDDSQQVLPEQRPWTQLHYLPRSSRAAFPRGSSRVLRSEVRWLPHGQKLQTAAEHATAAEASKRLRRLPYAETRRRRNLALLRRQPPHFGPA